MELKGARSLIAMGAVALVVVTIWLTAGMSAPAQSTDPITAERIVNGETPLGLELAAELGLPFEKAWDRKCQAFVEVGGNDGGYCIEGVTDDPVTLHVLGYALQGHRPTEDELAAIEVSLDRAEYQIEST